MLSTTALHPAAVLASDRPYLLTSTAAAEEDDDQVWSLETWWQRAGSKQVFNLAPEYAFNPTTSVQLELSFEHQLPWRSFAFAEVGREDRQALLHAGVRHWIKRERFAVDFSAQQLRGGGDTTTGVVIGLAWYEL